MTGSRPLMGGTGRGYFRSLWGTVMHSSTTVREERST